MDTPDSKSCKIVAQQLGAEILSAVQGLRPLSSLFPAFFVAEQERLAAVRNELAAIDAEIADHCAKRDAAARRLVALAGRQRPAPPPDNVAFPFARRAAP